MADDRVSELVIRGKNLSEQAFSEANRDLKGLQANAAGATRDMGTLGAQGTRAFTDMRGAVSELAGAFGVAFSIGAAVQFGKSVFDTASKIHDLAEQIGISTDAVQGFKFAAEQSGSSLDAVGTAITKMNKNLAEGDKSTVAALKSVGLDFASIRAMSPEDAFLAIADAIQKIPDPMVQSQVALQLFGKSAAELLPAIKEGFRDTAAAADKMSEETIKSLESAQDAWDKLGTKVTIITGDMIAVTMNATGQMSKSWKNFLLFADNAMKFGIGTAVAMANAQEEAERGGKKAKDVYLGTAKAITTATDATKNHAAAMREVQALTAEQVAVNALVEKAKQNEAASVRFATSVWKSWESTVSNALQNIANNPSLPLLQGRNLTAAAPLIQVPESTVVQVPPAVKQGFFASVFGTPAEFGKSLSSTVMAAIQGGGNAISAAGSLIGTGLMSGLAKTITSGAGLAIGGALGGAINAILPGLGSLLGPLMSKAWDGIKGLFGMGSAGRDLVKDFAASFGGFDALQAKLQALGAQGEQLWIKLTQGVGKNNAQQAKAAIEEVTKALEANEKKIQDNAAAAAAAAEEITAAQQAAMDAAKSQLQELDDQIKSLQDSIADEAPEEVMGIVEAQARAQIDALQKQRDAAAATMETLNKNTAESLDQVAEALKNLPDAIEVKVRLTYEEGGFAGGRYGALPPPVYPTTEGSSRASASGRVVQLVLGGGARRVLAQTVLKEQPGVLGAYGVAR